MAEAITRILVPIDFSPHSDRALLYATTLATRFGARMELLHVVEDPFVSGAWTAEAFVPNIPELLADLAASAQEKLNELKAGVKAKGLAAEASVLTTVQTGRPADSIAEYAKAGKFDLIVMGTHGRGGLSHIFMGSVAERVVRKAPCPVLTVREMTTASQEKSEAKAMTAA